MIESRFRLAVEGAGQVVASLVPVERKIDDLGNAAKKSTSQLSADLAKMAGMVTGLFSGVTETLSDVNDETKRTDVGIKLLTGGLAAMGVVLSAGYFHSFITDTIESTAELRRMTVETGTSASGLSALLGVAKLSGTGAEILTASLNKINHGLAGANDESKGAAEAIRALGIKFDEFNKLSPEEKMLAVAKSLGQFKDGGDKVAIVMQLFGESGAQLLPMLKDLAEVGQLNGKRTEEQALQAEAYQRSMKRLTASTEAWKGMVSMAVLPVMSELAQSTLKSINMSGGLNGAVKELTADGSLTTWARNSVIGLTYLLDIGQALLSLFPLVGKVIGGVAAIGGAQVSSAMEMVDAVKRGDFTGAFEAVERGINAIKTISIDTGKDVAEIWDMPLLGDRIRSNMESVRLAGAVQKEVLKDLKFSRDEAKKQRDPVDDLIKSLREKISVQKASVEAQDALTDAERVEAKFISEIADGYLKATPRQKEYVHNLINQLKEEERRADVFKRNVKYSEEMRGASEKEVSALDAEIKKQREKNTEIGLSAEQLIELQDARARAVIESDMEAAAALRVAAAYAGDLHDAYILYAHDLEVAAKKKNELANLKIDAFAKESAQKIDAEYKKTSENITDYLSNALVNGLGSGKTLGKELADYLKNMFGRLVLRPVISPIADSIAGMLGGGYSVPADVSGMSGVVGGGGAGGLAGLSSVLGSVGSVFERFGGQVEGVVQRFVNWADGISYSPGVSVPGQAASMAGQLAGNAMSVYVGHTVGNMIAGKYQIGNHGQAVTNIASVAGAILGGPIGGAIGGAIGGFLNRAFGRGPKTVDNTTLTGKFSTAGQFTGQTNQYWHQDGGWFRSDKKGVDVTAADAQTVAMLTASYQALTGATKQYAQVLGLNAESIAQQTTQFNITLHGDASKNAEEITNFFAKLGDEFAQTVFPKISEFQKQGESLSATLQRVSTNYASFDIAMRDLGMSISLVGESAISAKNRVVELSGGAQVFSAQASWFTQNYLTESERIAPTMEAVRARMQELGYANVTSVEQYKNLVRAQDLTTESGAKTYSALMNLAPAFKAVADFADQAAKSAESERKANEAKRDELQIQLLELQGKSNIAEAARRNLALLAISDENNKSLQMAIYAQQEKNAQQAAQQAEQQTAQQIALDYYEREKAALQDVIDKRKEEIKALKDFSQSLAIGKTGAGSEAEKYSIAKTMMFQADSTHIQSAVSQFLELAGGRAANSVQYAEDYALSQLAIQRLSESATSKKEQAEWQLEMLPSVVAEMMDRLTRKKSSIPAFDVGTNYVPNDMVALIHQGERIIPAADNRQLMSAMSNGVELSQLIEKLIGCVNDVGENRLFVMQHLVLIMNMLRKWDGSGMPASK